MRRTLLVIRSWYCLRQLLSNTDFHPFADSGRVAIRRSFPTNWLKPTFTGKPVTARTARPGHQPGAGTDSCQVAHASYVVSGRFAVRMDDGTEARMVTCHPCGVEFRAQRADQIDELVAAVQQHASGPHRHDVSREHILS